MSLRSARYGDVRDRMHPGDVIAFSGKGHFSEIIKWATRSGVSHIGVVLHTKLQVPGAPAGEYFNQVIESTSLNGFSGVSISRLSDRVQTYEGELWWLPLADKVRKKLDEKKFFSFMLQQDHKPYDTPQAIKSALDAMDNLPLIGNVTHNVEDFSKFFCSELAAAGLEAGGAIPHLNASEVTPIDLCMFDIYQKDYYQMKGIDRAIKGYNSQSPRGWGE